MNNMYPFQFQSSYLVRHSNSHCWNTVVKLMANLKEKEIRGVGCGGKKKAKKNMPCMRLFYHKQVRAYVLFCVAMTAHHWASDYYWEIPMCLILQKNNCGGFRRRFYVMIWCFTALKLRDGDNAVERSIIKNSLISYCLCSPLTRWR